MFLIKNGISRINKSNGIKINAELKKPMYRENITTVSKVITPVIESKIVSYFLFRKLKMIESSSNAEI